MDPCNIDEFNTVTHIQLAFHLGYKFILYFTTNIIFGNKILIISPVFNWYTQNSFSYKKFSHKPQTDAEKSQFPPSARDPRNPRPPRRLWKPKYTFIRYTHSHNNTETCTGRMCWLSGRLFIKAPRELANKQRALTRESSP